MQNTTIMTAIVETEISIIVYCNNIDHIMLTPRFTFCDVTINTTFFDVVHFCVHFVIVGFKQIKAETRSEFIFMMKKILKMFVEEIGTSCKGAQ